MLSSRFQCHRVASVCMARNTYGGVVGEHAFQSSRRTCGTVCYDNLAGMEAVSDPHTTTVVE